jgi:hypothetical protein
MALISAALPSLDGKDKSDLPLREKLKLFGPTAIPLIFPYGSKGVPKPFIPWGHYCTGWNKRTLADTQSQQYQHDLDSEIAPKNVGIRQGGGLTDIYAWDFDTDNPEIIGQFFKENPIEHGLFTVGRRGFTLWFRGEGDYPEECEININGEIIEWRNGKATHSLIHGRHATIDKLYRIFVLGEGIKNTVPWKNWNCPGPAWNKDWPGIGKKQKRSVFRAHLTPAQIAQRAAYVNSHYQVIDWVEEGKARVICKNEAEHTNPTREEDTIIFIGTDERGTISHHCSHSHCEQFNREQTYILQEDLLRGEDTFIQPASNEKLNQLLDWLFTRLAELGCFYRCSNDPPYQLCYWRAGLENVLTVTKGTLANILGQEKINFVKHNAKGTLLPVQAAKEFAIAILEAHQAKALPVLENISKEPLLCKTLEGAELVGEEYCPELKTIVLGKLNSLPEIDYQDALKNITKLMDYWLWQEPADRARAFAELLSLALLRGGFIPRLIPAFLVMADEYDAGKTAWHEDVGFIYGEAVERHTLTKNKSEAVEEQLANALLNHKPFFFLDDLDGTIKSPYLNSFITGAEELSVRTSYRPLASVSTRIIIMLAGVKSFIVDEQLCSRTMITRIIKPMEGDEHWQTPAGISLRSWIPDNSKTYLASIYALIKEWVKRGSVPDGKIKSRFGDWEKTVNGILAMIKLPSVTEGLARVQSEISNPAQNWLPKFSKCLEDYDLLYQGEGAGQVLSLEIMRALCDKQGIEIPNVNPLLRDKVLANIKTRRIGEIITGLPKTKETNGREPIFQLGEFYLAQYFLSNGHKQKKFYLFSTTTKLPEHPDKYQPEEDVCNLMN